MVWKNGVAFCQRNIETDLCPVGVEELVASGPRCQFFCQGGGMVWQCFERWSEEADAREIECHCQVGVANDGDCTALFPGFLQLLFYLYLGLCNDGC